MRKILIAPDSFKGCLSSYEVASTIEQAILSVFPHCKTIKLPVADGGEGTCDILIDTLGGKKIFISVCDPLLRPIDASYGILSDGKTAIIEMSSASGLSLLSEAERNPMLTSTYGTGQLVKDALLQGCSDFLIGIGGSATNDAGTGMLRALGYRFLDDDGKDTPEGGQSLALIASVDDSAVLPQLKKARFTVLCDVNSPFSGSGGAAFVYASQKGADARMVRQLDMGLEIFRQLVLKSRRIDLNEIAGAGAAGGMGGGILTFLNAHLTPGIEKLLEIIGFEDHVKTADLVITGEGKLDKQTAMGKTPLGILKIASAHQVPVIAIAGSVEDMDILNDLGFLSVFAITQGPATLQEAMKKENTINNIYNTVTQVMRMAKCLINPNK